MYDPNPEVKKEEKKKIKANVLLVNQEQKSSQQKLLANFDHITKWAGII